MATQLPLFPLGTVLVPGLVLPLHIFERRYRALVSDLEDLPEDDRLFGVIALRSAQEEVVEVTGANQPVSPTDDMGEESDDYPDDGLGDESGEGDANPDDRENLPPVRVPQLAQVGCSALIQEVTTYEDGRSELIAVGQERFRLLELVPDTGKPYLIGLVEFLDEPDGEPDLGYLAELVGLRFAAYRERLRVEQSGVPTDPRVLSYLVAAAAVLDLSDRQALLEAPTTAERLRAELVLLRREIGLLEAFSALPAVELPRQPIVPN